MTSKLTAALYSTWSLALPSLFQVLVTRGLDLAPGDEVDLNAVFMPSGGVFVAKMMEPEKP